MAVYRLIIGCTFVIEVRFVAGNKAVIGRKIFEEDVVVDTLSILETTELDLAWVSFFSLVDNVAIFGNRAGEKFIGAVELKPPNNVGGILNIAGFFEGFKRNALGIVEAIKRAYDDES